MNIEVRKPDAKRVQELAQQAAEKSRGRSILEKLRSGKGGIVKREIGGETVYIKRLTFPEIQRVRLRLPRDKQGVLNLSTEDHLRAVTIAMIATAVVEGFAEGEETHNEDGSEKTPTNENEIFTVAEAMELVDMRDSDESLLYVTNLFNAITDVNPHVLPNSQAAPSKA